MASRSEQVLVRSSLLANTGSYVQQQDFQRDSRHRFAKVRSSRIPIFLKSSEIEAPARTVFAWHQSPDALKTLIPPWEQVTIEQSPASLGNNDIAILVMHIGPLKLKWVARHHDFIDRGDAGGEFTDDQVSGPFASWVHRHSVRAIDPTRCVLEDHIEYALPVGAIGNALGGWHVRRKLTKMFDFRHEATRSAVRKMVTS